MRTIRVAREGRYFDHANMNIFRGEVERVRVPYSIDPADCTGITSGSPVTLIPLKAPYDPANLGYVMPYGTASGHKPLWVSSAYNGYPGYRINNTKSIYFGHGVNDTSGSYGIFHDYYNQMFAMVFVPMSGGTGNEYLLAKGTYLDQSDATYYNSATGELNIFYDWSGLYVNWGVPNVLIQILHLGYSGYPTPDGQPAAHVLFNNVHSWDVDTARSYVYYCNSIGNPVAGSSVGYYLLEWFIVERIPPRMYLSYARNLTERLMRKYG